MQSFINGAAKVGKGVLKFGSKYGSKISKAAKATGVKVGQWAIKHPAQAFSLASTGIAVATQIATADGPAPMQQPQLQGSAPQQARQREAIDELLLDTDEEDEKEEPVKKRKPRRSPSPEVSYGSAATLPTLPGGSLSRGRGQRKINRFVI